MSVEELKSQRHRRLYQLWLKWKGGKHVPHKSQIDPLGHGVGPKKLIAGRKFVGIMNIEPVGNYAIKIIFDDMHDSGLYSWRYLYQLGEEYEMRWEQYLADLKAEGKRREP